MITWSNSEKESKSTNAIQEYNQVRSHGFIKKQRWRRTSSESITTVKKYSPEISMQLFLLECDERLDNSDKNTQEERTSNGKSNVEEKHQIVKQPRKQTAKEARQKIYGHYVQDD